MRQRRYLVEDISKGPNPGDSKLVSLACVDDDAQGQELQVLWELELDAKILHSEDWRKVTERGFDSQTRFAAYLNTLKWNSVTATDPTLFQAPFRAGIMLSAYQLEPLRKALKLPRVNLFIADDVGLGKTIEAGLIARELLLRKKVREIVVACPPSMLYQWQDELASRFGLQFEILDREYVRKIRQERGFGINPWKTHPRFLVSHNLLIDESYREPLRDWLKPDASRILRPGTLLILDEAHHAAPASGQRYAIDSKITRAIREIAPLFEHRLFLSATPHNGHSNSFTALLELLDPQRFVRGAPVLKGNLDDVMVRRLKEDLRQAGEDFALRKAEQIEITGLSPDAPELRLQELLEQYRQLREQRLAGETKRQQAAAGLLICGLQQRLFSSVEAFARTLKVHRRTVTRQWEKAQAEIRPAEAKEADLDETQLDLLSAAPDADDERSTLSEEDLEREEEQQFEAASVAAESVSRDAVARALFEQEQRLLEEMAAIAGEHRYRPDARVGRLLRWIEEQMCPGLLAARKEGSNPPQWNRLRILIFTEYEATKTYLNQQLENAIAGTDRAGERIMVYSGATNPKDRERIKLAFNTDPAKHPVRILLATDAAREGLNLQAHCWNLFHFDLPWNPSRLEQRNGRIDRKLQPKPEVFCHYFVYAQRPEDRILATLVRKTETIKRELGSLSKVLDTRLIAILKFGIKRADVDRVAQEIESADLDEVYKQTVAEELESARKREVDFKTELDTLRNLLEKSKRQVGFDIDEFRNAISCSLELMGARSLKAEQNGGEPQWQVPPLHEHLAGGSGWETVMDTLRKPNTDRLKPAEWRRDAPIRPVVFEDTGRLNEDTVHLHLEHPLARRLLSRFSSQGFIHHDLSRACFAQTADPIPRVVLLGRLLLFGNAAARLHEEIIPVTARWVDPAVRKGALAPYAKDAESRTLSLLEASLRTAPREIPATQSKRLLETAPVDVEQLLPHLEKRAEEYAADAIRKLSARADAEARAMREILEGQQTRVAREIHKYEQMNTAQLRLEFANRDDEIRQLEENRKFWKQRLDALPAELDAEPQRVREVYTVKAQRVEPVGLVYLWPVTG